MATLNHTHVGTTLWVIDRDYISEPGEDNRIGYGQKAESAQATIESMSGYVGRTHYMDEGLKVSAIPEEYRVRFSLLTDDEESCYGGACDGRILTGELSGVEEDDDLGYNIDRFGMDDAGATIGRYKLADLIKVAGETEARRMGVVDYIEERNGGKTPEWVTLYA